MGSRYGFCHGATAFSKTRLDPGQLELKTLIRELHARASTEVTGHIELAVPSKDAAFLTTVWFRSCVQ